MVRDLTVPRESVLVFTFVLPEGQVFGQACPAGALLTSLQRAARAAQPQARAGNARTRLGVGGFCGGGLESKRSSFC